MIKDQNKKYDLEGRTIRFSEDIIDICKKIPRNPINDQIIKQLVRSATGIGANYCEANGASSKKDFRNKISICKKEAKETKYWIMILKKSSPEHKDQLNLLWNEAQELTLIFSKIVISTK